MLRELHISGLGVIDDLDLELHPGLNVLTGETGAGKTMVTVGLALALGTRADSSLVRDGAKAARVQARFDAMDGAVEWSEDGEVLLARSVNADGKSSARVGGQLATASTLAELGGALVEVHGQHQAQRLLSPTTQTGFLDRFAGDTHLVALAVYRESWERWRAARAALDTLEASTRERERELDLLAYQVHEIEAVDPSDGETERLTVEEARLAHVERLLERSTEAEEMLAGDASLGDAAASAANALAEAARLDPVADGLAERARSLATELAELARDVRGYREGLAADPARLQEIRERMSVLKGLQRKYGATEADVLSFLLEASSRLTVLATADERLADLSEEAERVRADLLLRQPGAHNRIGAVRSSACTWVFSSTHTTTALTGGFRYNPTTSRTLASNSGSVGNLNVSRRHGCTADRAPHPPASRVPAIAVRRLNKQVDDAAGGLAIFKDVDFTIAKGGTVAIVGASGSGKTTLLGMLAGLDTPTDGTVLLNGDEIYELDEDARAGLRQKRSDSCSSPSSCCRSSPRWRT